MGHNEKIEYADAMFTGASKTVPAKTLCPWQAPLEGQEKATVYGLTT